MYLKTNINQSHLYGGTVFKNIFEATLNLNAFENSWFEVFLNNLRAITECL